MSDDPAPGPVLVGVKNPDVVQQLVRTAGDLARLGSGSVRLVTVAVKPPDSPFGVFTDETIVRRFADDSHALLEQANPPPEVALEREVVPARSAAKGILSAVQDTDPDALVIGWHGESSRADTVLGTTVDTIVEQARCDLYVERVGREADGVDSILFPVAGGPHVTAGARMASAIADRNEASVTVLSVADPESDSGQAAGFVEEGREALSEVPGTVPTVETAVSESAEVTDTIAEVATAHDVVVMGATRKGSLRRKIVGSVPRTVVDLIDETVILARDADAVQGAFHVLGESFRRW